MKEIEISVTCTYTVNLFCIVPDDVYDELCIANSDKDTARDLPRAEYWLYKNIHLKDAIDVEYVINNLENV